MNLFISVLHKEIDIEQIIGEEIEQIIGEIIYKER